MILTFIVVLRDNRSHSLHPSLAAVAASLSKCS
jgi:hypothetical protein